MESGVLDAIYKPKLHEHAFKCIKITFA